MKHNEFSIGQNFRCGERLWRCTDIGTRVIVAIPADYAEITTASGEPPNLQLSSQTQNLTESDFNGPPYALAEIVFDEDDIVACGRI